MSGHLHGDYIHYENTENLMLNLNATCASMYKDLTSSDLARFEGTPTQDSFNVYSINRDRKVVKIAQVGSHINHMQSDGTRFNLVINAN